MFDAFLRSLARLRAHFQQKNLIPRQALGREAEDLAHRHLESLGYEVIDRNWFDAKALSEIDMVARHEGELVFIEVKSRTSEIWGPPEIALHSVKRAALRRGIREYARRAGVKAGEVRFDVVTVVMGESPKIEVLRGAPVFTRRRRNPVCWR